MNFDSPLPIDEALPALTAALRASNAAVLVAPPGAGKTTRVPLVLAREPWAMGKILVLEPRRIAARAAADRMAKTLGQNVGDTVGLRVRFGSKVSARTRIEVVTEGVFTRLILDDPELKGIVAVLFDEFHERSLDADLGLALAHDAQQGLREDLKILVMSATIDGARVAALLGAAPVVESQGRAFPVETRYMGRDPRARIEDQMSDAVTRALRADAGSVLAFLPGAAEIRRTETMLKERVDAATDVVALYGALDADTQDRAISPAPAGRRKVVLATSIAETSLTIEGVRIVVDSGLARVPRYEPDVGLTRLETVRVSRAAADQRRGRAGRTEPGIAYRLWDEPQTASLEAYARPEILAADLSSFVLDLAAWGAAPEKLAFLDSPPKGALAEARALLSELGALHDGRITQEGHALRRLPLPPRLARMVVDAAREGAGALAADIAAVLTERGLGGDDADLTHRVEAFRRDRSRRAGDARQMANRWSEMAGGGEGEMSVGAILSLAYPDRIAKNRHNGAFTLANGRGGNVDQASALSREPFVAVAELTGSAANARIVLAAPIGLAEIEQRFADRIENRDEVTFDEKSLSLRARRSRRLGAIALNEQTRQVEPNDDTARLLAEGLARVGIDKLPWTKSLTQWRDRVMFLRKAEGDEWPDLSHNWLAANMDWLMPALAGTTAISQLSPDDLHSALTERLPWPLRRRLDTEAPTHFTAPTGTNAAIDYEADAGPTISIRLQELFGLGDHPSIAAGRIPLVIELLSPGHKPVQITRDLPGFWRGSYAAVRTEMRGRYPRHPWPDDPLAAAPTRRAKPRGT
ncbi:MAG: ATP-dependent helicase HrpB [Hyphomicrobiales bacterium]|jgi:ATP-dependent helicase HrpB|nr:ATP-dependent helicase HrpB [Hyphomicrobiales bacterium]